MISKKNQKMIEQRKLAYSHGKLPRTGDFVKLPDGSYKRIAKMLPERKEPKIQLTKVGSFYQFYNAQCSYSGGLEYPINDTLELIEETKLGKFWFFSEGVSGAGRGFYYEMECRVYGFKGGVIMET